MVIPNKKYAVSISEDKKNLQIWDLVRQEQLKDYCYDRNQWQFLTCSSDSNLIYYGSQQSKLCYKMNCETADIQFRSYFKGNFVVKLVINFACTLIFIATNERKLIIIDAQTMDTKSELIISDYQIISIDLSQDDQTIIAVDDSSNLIKIDVQDVNNPILKLKDKIEGIGIPGSINLQKIKSKFHPRNSFLRVKKEDLLLIGASKGYDFLVYDIVTNQIVNRVHGHRRETPKDVWWIPPDCLKAISSSNKAETIGWNAKDWSPLFVINNLYCIPFSIDHNQFGGLFFNCKLMFWSQQMEDELKEEFLVDSELVDKQFINCSNDAFLERSISLNTQNMIQSDRLSKEEDQINKIVKPILYELLKEGSVDMTPKNDQNDKFFDLSQQLDEEDARLDQLRADALQKAEAIQKQQIAKKQKQARKTRNGPKHNLQLQTAQFLGSNQESFGGNVAKNTHQRSQVKIEFNNKSKNIENKILLKSHSKASVSKNSQTKIVSKQLTRSSQLTPQIKKSISKQQLNKRQKQQLNTISKFETPCKLVQKKKLLNSHENKSFILQNNLFQTLIPTDLQNSINQKDGRHSSGTVFETKRTVSNYKRTKLHLITNLNSDQKAYKYSRHINNSSKQQFEDIKATQYSFRDQVQHEDKIYQFKSSRQSRALKSSRPSFMSPTKSSKMKTISDKLQINQIMSDEAKSCNKNDTKISSAQKLDNTQQEIKKFDNTLKNICKEIQSLKQIKKRDDQYFKVIKDRQNKKSSKFASFSKVTTSFSNKSNNGHQICLPKKQTKKTMSKIEIPQVTQLSSLQSSFQAPSIERSFDMTSGRLSQTNLKIETLSRQEQPNHQQSLFTSLDKSVRRLQTLDKINTKRINPDKKLSQQASYMKQTRAEIKRSLSNTGQELKEMTRIHLVGLSQNKKKSTTQEEDEIYYGQLSDDLDHSQIQAPFMQSQSFEKPKLIMKQDQSIKQRISLQKVANKIKIDVREAFRDAKQRQNNPYVNMLKKNAF